MSHQWSVNESSVDMPSLYRRANQSGAMEPPSSDYWTAFWENVIKTSGKALRMKSQAPPTEDPNSEFRLRRIDFSVNGYSANGRRFALVFVEVKRASTSLPVYQEVERQAQGACETYLDETQDSDVHLVYAMCAVGTKCRLFRYTHDPDKEDIDWEPMWGRYTEPDPRSYIDGNDKQNGNRILEALHEIFTSPPAPLADASYLLVTKERHNSQACIANGRRTPNVPWQSVGRPSAQSGSSTLPAQNTAPAESIQSQQAYDAYVRLRNQRYSHDQCIAVMGQALQRSSPALDLESARATVVARIRAAQARANASD